MAEEQAERGYLSAFEAAKLLDIPERDVKRIGNLGYYAMKRGRYHLLELMQGYIKFLQDGRYRQFELGELCGMPSRQLDDLAKGGFIAPDKNKLYSLQESIRGIIAWAKGERRQNLGTETQKKLQAIRAKEIEQRMAAKGGQLVPVEEAEAFVATMMGEVVSRLAGLPAMIGTRDRDVRNRIERAVDGIRRELAALASKYGEACEAIREDTRASREE